MRGTSPLFSVVLPVYDPPLRFLRAAIRSVQAQTFGDWELILVDDHSPSPEIVPLLEGVAARDPRIKLVKRAENGGISVASNDAVAAASGEFIVLLDHDDLLAADALAEMARAISSEPEVDYLYSDEDKVGKHGRFFDRFDKPAWSPERMRHQNYACHLSVLRTSLVRDVGGFDSRYDGAQDHDLVLKVSERARKAMHVPRILYHWRAVKGSEALVPGEKPYAWQAGVRAVQAHMDRVGIAATVDFGKVSGTYSIVRTIPDSLRVSIVIPTRGASGTVWGKSRCFVVEAVRSALDKAGHLSVQVVVVHDAETQPRVLTELTRIVPVGDLLLVPYDEQFNFSRKCNLGVLASDGDVVVLLNDDTQARSEGWLVQLVAPLLEPDVGMTGARLLFEDGTLQHGGHEYARSDYLHAFQGAKDGSAGPAASLLVARECSGVSCACAALRRETFIEVGGMSERLPVNFNDVDLSHKVARGGYRILWIADAVLYHFESKTRTRSVHAWEAQLVRDRWGAPIAARDPFVPKWR